MYPKHIEHLLFHRGFESHTDWGPRTVEEFEKFVKIGSLFYRGIVISDSDLNNTPLFSSLTKEKNETILQKACKFGFIRRAARINQDDRNPVDQQAVFESFKKNSPERASIISEKHPKKLDKILEETENEYKPLTWEVGQLADVFATHLTTGLDRADFNKGEKSLANKILKYVEDLDGDYSRLRAAKIESEILPQWQKSESQRRVWEQVLQAYNGNLPYAFKGDLIIGDLIEGDKSAIPGGPESNNDEKEFAVDYYDAVISNKIDRLFVLREEQLTTSDEHWCLDTKKLLDLSIYEIVELREEADPDEYFNMRHDILSSPDSLEKKSEDLYESKNSYWAALCDAGIALNRSSEKMGRDKRYKISVARKSEDSKNELKIGTYKTFMEARPGSGELVSFIDADSTGSKTRGSRGADPINNINIKRPDYEVVKKLHRRILDEINIE